MKQGDKVDYDFGGLNGIGEVVGVATIDRPTIGRTLILRDLSGNVPNETYEFDTFVCPECLIVKV